MIELARVCKRTDTVQEYDQIQAAQHQLEGAIANLFMGNWPAAITLAGAAEDILPPHDSNIDFFSFIKVRAATDHGRSEKQIADMLNELRNWLKHDQTKRSNYKAVQEITQADAIVMILRAHSRFYSHHAPVEKNEILSENLEVFTTWFRANYSDWLEEQKIIEKQQ